MATNFDKIDYHQVKRCFMKYIVKDKYSSAKSSVLKPHRKQANINYTFPALEVHGETTSLDKMSLDICTYIYANGLCILHHNRLHRRISNYNWNKMKKLTNEIDNTIIKRANNIINIWLLKSATNRHKIESIDIADTSSKPEEKVNNSILRPMASKIRNVSDQM